MLESDPKAVVVSANFFIRHLPDEQPFLDCLLRWADGIDSGRYPTDAYSTMFRERASEDFMERVVDWAYRLALRAGSSEAADEKFGEIMEKLLTRSARLAAMFRPHLVTLSRRISFHRHRALHRLVLAARSRPNVSG